MPLTQVPRTTRAPHPVDHHAAAPVWDDLDAVEQSVLVVAANVQTLDRAIAFWSLHQHGHSDVQLTRAAASRLVHRGLIGLFRMQDDYPDLTGRELTEVLATDRFWDGTGPHARRVGLYLTMAGEQLVHGP